ncbi:polyprenyl synthetase family protein, partial [Streptomyces albiflaviniger]|nr:polyprenyl synthetase family protein [Streptomyces albiflaviniger]
GGRDWTSQEARRQHATAMEALGSVDMPAEIRARFVALADFVVVRER